MPTVPNMGEESKVEHFVKLTVNDIGAALNSVLVVIGDKLRLYKAMAEAGPLTSADLAKSTGTNERYIREWLAVQVCSDTLLMIRILGAIHYQKSMHLFLPMKIVPILQWAHFNI